MPVYSITGIKIGFDRFFFTRLSYPAKSNYIEGGWYFNMEKPVALVVGAAQGIGRASALKLAENGFDLIVNDIADLSYVIDHAKSSGSRAISVPGDITTEKTLSDINEVLNANAGHVRVMVHSVYKNISLPFLEVSSTQWIDIWSALFFSAVQVSKTVIPHMIKSGSGSIIYISSVHAAAAGQSGYAIYDSAKGALNALTKSLAVEFGPNFIRVNSIMPGAIITERNSEFWKEHFQEREVLESAYALRRFGNTEEVANLVNFLACEDSSFITGATIPVDGGLLAGLGEVGPFELLKAGLINSKELKKH